MSSYLRDTTLAPRMFNSKRRYCSISATLLSISRRHIHLGVVEVGMFISALIRNAYDYTQWRQEYFENAYKDGEGSQLENFLNAAADNDPYGVSFGIYLEVPEEDNVQRLTHAYYLVKLLPHAATI